MNKIIYLFLFITFAYGDIQKDIYKNAQKHIGETYWAKKKRKTSRRK